MRTPLTTSSGLVGWTTGAGPEVLLLHGGPGMSDYMDSLLPELDGHRVASYQQRGLAPSTLEGPFDVERAVADVVAVLDELGWAGPTIIGHSWGGHLLLHLLAARPERVGAALVVDPLGAVGDGGLEEFQAEMDARLTPASRPRAQELDAKMTAGESTDEDHVEAMRLCWPSYFADRGNVPAMPPLRFASAKASKSMWDSLVADLPGLAGRLRGCAVPTRFVHGAESPMPVTASTETAAMVGAPCDVVAGVGHFPWLEEPDRVRHNLHQLLGSLPPADRR